mmetsp:Transcript_37111/g.81479  ORF Transcript_37111/g.81479 Transcript_37111/m.81479 type:complete len:236 (+) Transcript_37111:2800-3507(+)
MASSTDWKEIGPPLRRIMTLSTSPATPECCRSRKSPEAECLLSPLDSRTKLAAYFSNAERNESSEPKAFPPLAPESTRIECVWCCCSPASLFSSSESSIPGPGASTMGVSIPSHVRSSSFIFASSSDLQRALRAPNGEMPMHGTILFLSCLCMALPTRPMTPLSVPPVITHAPVCLAAATRPLAKCSSMMGSSFMKPAPPLMDKTSLGASKAQRSKALTTLSKKSPASALFPMML